MASKKILKDNGTQIWPITRDDCVYTSSGEKIGDIYATNAYVNNVIENLITEEDLNTLLDSIFGTIN